MLGCQKEALASVRHRRAQRKCRKDTISSVIVFGFGVRPTGRFGLFSDEFPAFVLVGKGIMESRGGTDWRAGVGDTNKVRMNGTAGSKNDALNSVSMINEKQKRLLNIPIWKKINFSIQGDYIFLNSVSLKNSVMEFKFINTSFNYIKGPFYHHRGAKKLDALQ